MHAKEKEHANKKETSLRKNLMNEKAKQNNLKQYHGITMGAKAKQDYANSTPMGNQPAKPATVMATSPAMEL